MKKNRITVRLEDELYSYNLKLTRKQIDFLQWLNDRNLLANHVDFEVVEKEEVFEEP